MFDTTHNQCVFSREGVEAERLGFGFLSRCEKKIKDKGCPMIRMGVSG